MEIQSVLVPRPFPLLGAQSLDFSTAAQSITTAEPNAEAERTRLPSCSCSCWMFLLSFSWGQVHTGCVTRCVSVLASDAAMQRYSVIDFSRRDARHTHCETAYSQTKMLLHWLVSFVGAFLFNQSEGRSNQSARRNVAEKSCFFYTLCCLQKTFCRILCGQICTEVRKVGAAFVTSTGKTKRQDVHVSDWMTLLFSAVTSAGFNMWWIFIVIAVVLLLLILLLCCCLCMQRNKGDTYNGTARIPHITHTHTHTSCCSAAASACSATRETPTTVRHAYLTPHTRTRSEVVRFREFLLSPNQKVERNLFFPFWLCHRGCVCHFLSVNERTSDISSLTARVRTRSTVCTCH